MGLDDSIASKLPERVLVVTGATASGKSDLAVEIAAALGGEIVGADSRQVYRGLDAGTAKPTAQQRARVAHHLIDIVDPDEDLDVARWRSLALGALAGIAARGRIAIVCGGTGLYVRSLVRGLFRGPAADAALRGRLTGEERERPGALHDRLLSVDPASAARIHRNDVVRLVRALEVYERTGRPMSAWHDEHALAERPFETLILDARRAPAELAHRIEQRSRDIVAAGIVAELAGLWERGYARDLVAFDAIGYREAARCLDGALAQHDLAAEIAKATRAYAKRQRVWIRGQSDAETIDAGDAPAAIARAQRFFADVAKRQGIG